MNCSSCAMKTTTPSSPRLSIYAGDPVIDGRLVPKGDGELPRDFGKRLVRFKEAADVTWDELADLLGVEPKQLIRWANGTEPSGGAYHSLVRLAPWVPGRSRHPHGRRLPGPPQGGLTTCPASAPDAPREPPMF